MKHLKTVLKLRQIENYAKKNKGEKFVQIEGVRILVNSFFLLLEKELIENFED